MCPLKQLTITTSQPFKGVEAILPYLRDSVAMVRLPRRLEEEAQRLSHTNRPRSSH